MFVMNLFFHAAQNAENHAPITERGQQSLSAALNLICASQCSPKVTHSFLVSKIKCSVRVGGIARRQHRVPAIERDLVEQ
jgi:hypothetical protein